MSSKSALLTEFSSACDLVAAIKQRHVSSREVVDCYIERIHAVNPRLNAVVADRFEDARREADDLDRQGSQDPGLLHGLPVTIKEMFDVQGMPTTAGISRRSRMRVSHDATAVSRWRQAGAIVLGKTNVPQLGMLIETDNPVYGCTHNPWNLDRSPGGSSGGEAAIIAAGASPLGLGSDGAGSIRIPAHFCGISGFKPTGGQLSMRGHWLSKNWPADWAQPGPMARSVADLVLGLRALLPSGRPEPGEAPSQLRVPTVGELSGLRVGVYEQLPTLPAAASVRRAMRLAAECLERVGVDVVPFRPPSLQQIWDNYMAIFYAEGLRDVKRQLAGSPVDDRIRQVLRMTSVPARLRPMLARIAKRSGQYRLGRLFENLKQPVLGADRYCELMAKMQGYRHHFARRLERERLDAVLAPAAPMPAVNHGEFYANYAMIYTGVYNLLAMPAGVIPVTVVREDEVPDDGDLRDPVDQSLLRANRGSVGLPIGVQVIADRWQDGLVLALLQAVESELMFETQPQLLAPLAAED